MLLPRILPDKFNISRLLLLTLFIGELCFASSDLVKADSQIRTSRLADIAMHPESSAPAIAITVNNATISAEIQARVEQFSVNVSQQVKKGQLLLELNCEDYRLQEKLATAKSDAAKAYLQLARNELERAQNLFAKALNSEQNVDTARTNALARKAELDMAAVELKQASTNVSRCSIAAPFDAVVTARNAATGQLATPGTPLITLVDIQNIELSAQVAPGTVAAMENASGLYFEADQRFEVSLLRTGAAIDTRSRSQELRLGFVNKTPLAGTAGKLVWQDRRPFVPARLVQQNNGESGIYIMQDQALKFYPLDDASPGRNQPVSLPADTLIVTAGFPDPSTHVAQFQ